MFNSYNCGVDTYQMITQWTRPKSFISQYVVRLPTASGVRAGTAVEDRGWLCHRSCARRPPSGSAHISIWLPGCCVSCIRWRYRRRAVAPPCTVIDSKLRSRLVLPTSELFYSIDYYFLQFCLHCALLSYVLYWLFGLMTTRLNKLLLLLLLLLLLPQAFKVNGSKVKVIADMTY